MSLTLPDRETMYQALARRDESFVGVFWVGVRTTGVLCRPGCPARAPKPENVEYFASASDGLHAGYRPCLRCRPLEWGVAAPQWVESLMRHVDERPAHRFRDRDLRSLGVEPERARRYWKAHFGMTFQAYSRARRMGLAMNGIREGQDKIDAAIETGYDSDTGFRDAFERILGAPPTRASEVQAMLCRWLDTPLGAMLAVANEDALCLLEFIDRRMLETQIHTLRKRFGAAVVPGTNAILDQTERELREYFAGERRAFDVPWQAPGTEFQQRVWRALCDIPYGNTESYGDLARRLGHPDAQRAVGKTNGDNRLAIVIPCHRVIKSDGSLCGYGGGLWRKQRLLELEAAHTGLFA